MNKYEGKLAGIIGTVIIHLIAAILFMSFKLQSIKKDLSQEFIIEFNKVEQPQEEEKKIELPSSGIEKILQGDQELLNIARNLANKSDVKINPEDYIDKVKDELIKDGKLGKDNYIDEQKKQNSQNGDENMAFNDKEEEDSDKPKESQEMAANYKGPTRIYYDLAGRNHTYLPIPIYKCEGSGVVVLSIKVNQLGYVEDARIIESQSTTSDPCLTETAVKSALISRFNPDINAPKIQMGTLTYHFVKQ